MNILKIFLLILITTDFVIGQTAVNQKKNVAILIFNGVQIIDYTGPYEVFGQAGMKVFTVSEKSDTIVTHMKMQIIPNYLLENCPVPDIIVIPGGNIHSIQENRNIINWLQTNAKKSEFILSVCGGAFLLASSGLLDGLEATTYAPLIEHFRTFAKKTKVVSDKRFVDNGKILTAGGLSAGIDVSLHVVSKIYGTPRAQEVANNMEYNWDKNSKYVRTQLADIYLTNLIDFDPPLKRKTLKYEGNESNWIIEYEVERNESLQQFSAQLAELAEHNNWVNLSTNNSTESISSIWQLTDNLKRKWICKSSINKVKNEGNKFIFTLLGFIETNTQQTGNASNNSSPCSEAERRQFDFWIGDWDVSWDKNGKGTNVIKSTLDGCVIVENFDGNPGMRLRGMSVSTYNAKLSKWQQTWVDNEGSYMDFTGEFKDGKMILQRKAVINRKEAIQRMVWYNITKDKLDWNWERSEDDGKTWNVLWKIAYIRKK
jgi:putative intracellular protease/amidase